MFTKAYPAVQSKTPSRWPSVIALAILTLVPVSLSAQGTIMPTPFQTAMDTNGDPINNAKICTYVAGTSTAATTYTTSAMSVANANPIRADAAGRFVAFLVPGASYKFEYQTASGTVGVCDGASIKTVDNISAVPAGSNNVDVTGTAGEALTAGQAVYLSDGSASKVAGQWYKADATTTYSSNLAIAVGMVPSSIASAASGTVRMAGRVTGLTGLTAGTIYYVSGTPAALTSTAPVNRRLMGIADSTSTIVLNANPATATINNGTDCFRLTLTSGTPVTTADVTAATTLYATPTGCNRIALFDSVGNASTVTSAEFSIAIPATTSQMYDVFAYSNAGVATLELLAWSSDTARATAIVLTTTGSYTKTGDLTRRYLGSVRTTTVSGQTEDSFAKRYLWNYYNRVPRGMRVLESSASWTYDTATWRQARATATNQTDCVVGVAEVLARVRVDGLYSNTAAAYGSVNIGQNSTTTPMAGVTVQSFGGATAGMFYGVNATVEVYPAVGRTTFVWLEFGGGATSTFYGTNGAATQFQTGIHGWIEG